MSKSLLALVILSLSIACCTKSQIRKADELEKIDPTIYVTPAKKVLFSKDHNSEGFLVQLKDERILLIFRLDPGLKGAHVGEGGYIAKIPYNPLKDEWGEVETVYNSHRYDDRNMHGGITNDGRIVVYFRRYDGSRTEGHYFIYSEDNGNTWSDPKVISDSDLIHMKGALGTGQMFYNPDIEKYIMLGSFHTGDQAKGYASSKNYITYSRNGVSWEEYNVIPINGDYRLNEIAGAWCGNGRIIALQRSTLSGQGHPLRQIVSHDNGQTWSDPVLTNMPPKQEWGVAPQLIYDKERDLLIALTSDRYSRADEKNSLFIYTARPDEVFSNPHGWTLQHELQRPWAKLGFKGNRPLNSPLYGYPTITALNEQEYLVVFTESASIHGTQQADLYYFRLIIK